MARHTFYAWPSSPYSAKVRAFFRYRHIEFDEVTPSVVTFKRHLIPKVGRMVIPVVITDAGEVLQDSDDIIQALDDPAAAPIHLADPILETANRLLSLLADEWMVMSAMRYRWQRADNYPFIVQDFGRCIAPWFPLPLQRLAGKQVAKRMQAHLRRLGIVGDMGKAIDQWTESYLQAFNAVLADQPYILGSTPVHADFALYGPIYAHLYRDPASQEVVTACPHVVAWLERLSAGATALGNDTSLHNALLPVLNDQFADQIPALLDTAQRLVVWREQHAHATHPPAHLGSHAFTVQGQPGTRLARTFSLLRLQGIQQYVWQLPKPEQEAVRAWLRALGSDQCLDCEFPQLTREQFVEVFADH